MLLRNNIVKLALLGDGVVKLALLGLSVVKVVRSVVGRSVVEKGVVVLLVIGVVVGPNVGVGASIMDLFIQSAINAVDQIDVNICKMMRNRVRHLLIE